MGKLSASESGGFCSDCVCIHLHSREREEASLSNLVGGASYLFVSLRVKADTATTNIEGLHSIRNARGSPEINGLNLWINP